MFKRILVAYDGSDGSRTALKRAIELANAVGAELVSISVEAHLPYYAASISEVKATKEQVDEHVRTLTQQAGALAALSGIELETIVLQGHEVERIVSTARDGNFDLLVSGYHGHSAIFDRVMGGTAHNIVRHAPCPVLLVK